MCILSKPEILKMLKKGKIRIEPFDPTLVDAASVDFRLGNTFRVFKKGIRFYDLRDKPDLNAISDVIEVKDGDYYPLRPRELIHGITREKLYLPDNICGRIGGRSSLARIGLMVHITAELIHPGSSGNQVLEIKNMSPMTIRLYPGVRICQIVFETMKGKYHYTGEFGIQSGP